MSIPLGASPKVTSRAGLRTSGPDPGVRYTISAIAVAAATAEPNDILKSLRRRRAR
jgi:hypothetical protein